MVSLAVAGHPGFVACPVEIERAGPSYSVDTVEMLAGDSAGARLFFLMGSDTFLDLPDLADARSGSASSRRSASATGPAAHSSRTAPRRAPCSRGSAGRAGAACPRSPRRPWRPGSARWSRRDRSRCRREACASASPPGRASGTEVPLAVAEYIAQHGLYREPA